MGKYKHEKDNRTNGFNSHVNGAYVSIFSDNSQRRRP